MNSTTLGITSLRSLKSSLRISGFASPVMPFSAERELPDELLAEIISFCPQSTLAALCRTCKRMNRLAAASLYCKLVVT